LGREVPDEQSMRDTTGQETLLDRPSTARYKGQHKETDELTSAGLATIQRREQLFGTIRLSRILGSVELDIEGALVDLPRVIICGTDVYDMALSRLPGVMAEGSHEILATVVIGPIEVSGHFHVAVGETDVVPAQELWTAKNRQSGHPHVIPAEIAAQLPRSFSAPVLRGRALTGAVRRAHLAAERSRQELIETNRGLVRSVVNRYRSVVRSESSALDMSDLMIVGEHQVLHVVERHFSDPAVTPVRDVAWSKLVQRAIGNAVRGEIARATGVSVEFRQLLTWFHAHPEDRMESPAVVAQGMAFAAGVTRLMAKRNLRDRFAGIAQLEMMLESGEARYVPPGRGAAEVARGLVTDGVFVISSRSSLAEIERAQHFAGTSVVWLDADDDTNGGRNDRSGHLATSDGGYDTADWNDTIKHIIEDSGMTEVEALVWLHRTGALDPGGFGNELPEIAEDLGLSGRSEARAALRRARRKIDAWAADSSSLAKVG
jgi:hypothetical protein